MPRLCFPTSPWPGKVRTSFLFVLCVLLSQVIFLMWRLNHFYSFLLGHGSQATNKHYPAGRSVKSETPTCLPLSRVRISPSGHMQFLRYQGLTLHLHCRGDVRATNLYVQVHFPWSDLSWFSRGGSASCAEMPWGSVFKTSVLGH